MYNTENTIQYLGTNRNGKEYKKEYMYVCGGSDGKDSACNAGELGLIPELGRSPGEGNGYPL